MKITVENDRKSAIKANLEAAVEKYREEVPAGYIEIQLSTKGKLGAPNRFHIRNFKTNEIMELSLTPESDLPRVLLSVLQNMIFEDVDVSAFHVSEIEETLLYVYMTFFSPSIDNIKFKMQDEDWDFLEKSYTPEEFAIRKDDILSGRWNLLTSFDIQSGVDTYEIPSNFKKEITIKKKEDDFEVKFRYLRYSDQIIINDFLNRLFGEKDAIYRDIDENSFGRMSESEKEDYRQYRIRRATTASLAYNYSAVVELNGLDLREMPLHEKYEVCSEEPRLDAKVISILNKIQARQNFGLKPEVSMVNPITHKLCKRSFPFRVPVILSAYFLFEPDWDDDGNDDEAEYIVE